jgi:7-cyano-7-deazaguanine synthase
MNKKAVILVSGGLDSATCLAIARSEGFACYALTFDYDQRHKAELTTAQRIAQVQHAVEHRIVKLDIASLCRSALTDNTIAVPDYTGDGKIPATYVPARNTIFLSVALGWAEVLGAHDIFAGMSNVDYSGYPDCRPEYLEAFQKMASLATKAGVEGNPIRIQTPLLHLNKAKTIQLGMKLGVDYSLVSSCYQPDEHTRACGRCDSCTLHKKGFHEAGVPDPTRYY